MSTLRSAGTILFFRYYYFLPPRNKKVQYQSYMRVIIGGDCASSEECPHIIIFVGSFWGSSTFHQLKRGLGLKVVVLCIYNSLEILIMT
jgi:hypothetical protein